MAEYGGFFMDRSGPAEYIPRETAAGRPAYFTGNATGTPAPAPRMPGALAERITAIFLGIGIPAHNIGFQYLREAVRMAYFEPAIINRITKGLYPGIAERFSASAGRVERAIRHSLEVAFERGMPENLNRLFGCSIYGKYDRPTNGEFIALVADRLLIDDAVRHAPY